MGNHLKKHGSDLQGEVVDFAAALLDIQQGEESHRALS